MSHSRHGACETRGVPGSSPTRRPWSRSLPAGAHPGPQRDACVLQEGAHGDRHRASAVRTPPGRSVASQPHRPALRTGVAVAEPNGLEVRPRRWLPVEPPLELAEATGVVASSHGRPAVHLPAPHDGERYALHLVPAQLARDPLKCDGEAYIDHPSLVRRTGCRCQHPVQVSCPRLFRVNGTAEGCLVLASGSELPTALPPQRSCGGLTKPGLSV